jgi:hypothetical protein
VEHSCNDFPVLLGAHLLCAIFSLFVGYATHFLLFTRKFDLAVQFASLQIVLTGKIPGLSTPAMIFPFCWGRAARFAFMQTVLTGKILGWSTPAMIFPLCLKRTSGAPLSAKAGR